MSRFHITFPSGALRMRTDVNVFIPDYIPEGKNLNDLPQIYLLHGLSGSRDDWMLNTSLARYVEELELIVICPEGERGFYLDLPHGPQWYSYITKELPAKLKTWMNLDLDPSKTFIAGDSMGAYGACRMAALNPEQYKAMAAFSGPLSIDFMLLMKEEEPDTYLEMTKQLGGELDSLYGTDKDPNIWLEAFKGIKEEGLHLPDLSFYCGTNDPFIDLNRYYTAKAKQMGIPVHYSEDVGVHDFAYWDKALHSWLLRISEDL